MVSCLSPPLPAPKSPSKVRWSSKLLSLPPPTCPALVFVLLFLVFGGVRVPSESLLVERDDHLRTLHVGLLRRHQVGLVRVFPAQTKTKCHQNKARRFIQGLKFRFHTNHFMRNMSSPVESVAPMILSGASPRAKPLSFSVWGANDNTSACSQSKCSPLKPFIKGLVLSDRKPKMLKIFSLLSN